MGTDGKRATTLVITLSNAPLEAFNFDNIKVESVDMNNMNLIQDPFDNLSSWHTGIGGGEAQIVSNPTTENGMMLSLNSNNSTVQASIMRPIDTLQNDRVYHLKVDASLGEITPTGGGFFQINIMGDYQPGRPLFTPGITLKEESEKQSVFLQTYDRYFVVPDGVTADRIIISGISGYADNLYLKY